MIYSLNNLKDEHNLSVSFIKWDVGYGEDNPTATLMEVICFDESVDLSLVTMGIVSICQGDGTTVTEIEDNRHNPIY